MQPEGDLERRFRDLLEARDYEALLVQLADAYGDDLLGFCFGMLRSSWRPRDITVELASETRQEVFKEAFRSFPTFRGEASFKSWMYGIAKYRCFNLIAKEKRERLLNREIRQTAEAEHQASSSGTMFALAPSVEDGLMEAERNKAVSATLEDCLTRLDTESRTVVLLRHQEGWEWADIAKVINATRRETVTDDCPRKLAARAMKRLLVCLERKGVVL